MEAKSAVKHPAERGFFAGAISSLGLFVVFLLVALLFSILAEWIGMTWVWPEQGRRHSEAMLQQELRHLNSNFKRSTLVQDPARYARDVADGFHQVLYRQSGIERGLLWLASPSEPSGPMRSRLRAAYRAVSDYIVAAMTITQVYAVRIAVLTLALPAFALFGMVALSDGLVQRDLRRWGGGRESAFVYHWAKRVVKPALILPWILYLSSPVSIHPNLVVLPFAGLFAGAVYVMAATFKKYL